MSTPTSSGAKRASSANQSFELFKKQAREKEERERLMREQEEQRKQNTEKQVCQIICHLGVSEKRALFSTRLQLVAIL